MTLLNILNTNNFCTTDLGYKLFGILGHILNFIHIIIPALLILMASIDLLKALTSGKSETISNSFAMMAKRIISGVLIFFLPTIISYIMGMINVSSDNQCYKCVLVDPGVCIEKGFEFEKTNK